MVNAMCKTSLDKYKTEEWPDKFVAVPSVGDWVESKSGKVLSVINITHYMRKTEHGLIPAIEVELNK